ncbi:MAG: P1 family peptidase [Cytophagaceae bacterium]|nr:P1 family peptidase [Cytophagaceae bacterium]
MKTYLLSGFLFFFFMQNLLAQSRFRDTGLTIGILKTGSWNAITDVPGVSVGHVTLIRGDSVRTGVTAIVPHPGNLFQQKVPAAVFVGNGFGKMAGISQINELGNLETPIVLTNTLSVPAAMDGLISHTLAQPGNERVRSVNAVVGETNDGFLNDIAGRHVKPEHVLDALKNAKSGVVAEGNVGAGTGTVCFGWKGGIGTSSRVLPRKSGGYTLGVLVQTNFGGVLEIKGVPLGVELGKYFLGDQLNDPADGSCLVVVATDAPITARNLERLAKRAWSALARVGGIASNGSGEYVLVFSTNEKVRVPLNAPNVQTLEELSNEAMSPLFLAVLEATEEAIINALWAARTLKGHHGTIEELPRQKVLERMKKRGWLR